MSGHTGDGDMNGRGGGDSRHIGCLHGGWRAGVGAGFCWWFSGEGFKAGGISSDRVVGG
jgi:hypothetical protein